MGSMGGDIMTSAKIVTGAERRAGRPAVGSLVALIVLMSSGVWAADVVNSSFEATYGGLPWPRPLPLYWGHADHPSFNSYCASQWSTEGAQSAALFNRSGKPVSPGNGQSFYQYVDLTDMESIEFDVSLATYPMGVFQHFEALLLVDGVPFWRANTGGVYRDQRVDVSGLAGWHRLEIRDAALDAGTFSVAYWVQWDNIRLVEGPATIPALIDLDPSTLNLGSNGNWITCYIELAMEYDAEAIDGATVTLDDIPAFMGKQGWATPQANEENVGDYDSDGVVERMVRFERAAVQDIVRPPETTVTVAGWLDDGTPFEGPAVIRVLDKGAKKK
jgi:hypothetical protein